MLRSPAQWKSLRISGTLKDWRLLFRQFATIKKCKGYSVPVLVWKISEQDEKKLDRYEGFPRFYIKKNLKVDVIVSTF